jgi:MSHA biogenesis protein MshL
MNQPNRLHRTLLAGFLLLLGGCQSFAPPAEPESPPAADSALGEIDSLLASGVTLPARPSAPQMPPQTAPTAAAAPAAPRFDLAVRELDVRQLLAGLATDGEENIVVHPEVGGSVSLQLRDVSVAEVLGVLRDVYGYQIRPSTSGWYVFPATLQTRVYPLNYLNVERAGFSQTRVSSGQVSQQGGGEQVSSGDGGAQVSGSIIETRSQASLWSEVEAALRTIIGESESDELARSVVVSPQSGMVVVRALPGELREVETYLRETQQNLHRQVILEAKIVEVELAEGYQSGVNWAALGDSGGDSLLLGQTGGGSVFGSGLSEIAGNGGVLDPGNLAPVSNTETSAFGGVFSAALKLGDFAAFIELLGRQGEVQVLSSPRVSTINNQKAVIKVGSDEYFVTEISSGDVSGTGNTGNTIAPDITLTPFFSGIALDVTPQIDAAGGVTLHIHPSVTEVIDQTKTVTVNGQTQSLPLALSSVRESDSVVHATSGQLIVIGGLMQNRASDETAGVPLLKDLPLIGELFRHNKRSTRKSELVILLRPLVVDNPSVWADALADNRKRVRALHHKKGY